MPQPSRVALLSPELRQRLHALLQDPAITLTQVAELINEQAGKTVVSKSGVHRYQQRMRRWAEQNRQARLVVEELSQQMGAEGAQRFSEAMLFQVRTMVFDLAGAVRELQDSGGRGCRAGGGRGFRDIGDAADAGVAADRVGGEPVGPPAGRSARGDGA